MLGAAARRLSRRARDARGALPARPVGGGARAARGRPPAPIASSWCWRPRRAGPTAPPTGSACWRRRASPFPPLTIDQRLDRAERLLRGGVPKTAADEAERIVTEVRDPSIVVRALRIVADGAQRLGRHEAAAKRARPRHSPGGGRPAGRRFGSSRPGCCCAPASASRPSRSSPAWRRAARRPTPPRRSGCARARSRTPSARPTRRRCTARWRRAIPSARSRAPRSGGSAGTRTSRATRARPRSSGASWWTLPATAPYRQAALYWRARATEEARDRAAAAPLYAQVIAEAPRSYYGHLTLARTGGARSPGTLGVGHAARRSRRGTGRRSRLRARRPAAPPGAGRERAGGAGGGRRSGPPATPCACTASRAPTCATSAITWRCASSAGTSPRSPPAETRRCRARSGRCSTRSAGATT